MYVLCPILLQLDYELGIFSTMSMNRYYWTYNNFIASSSTTTYDTVLIVIPSHFISSR